MAMKQRPLLIFQYLWDNTDEDHPVTIKEIISYLDKNGIHTNRRTVALDLISLQESGFDIICNRSVQNQYFIGNRRLETAELKTIIDAILAAKFISPSKTKSLIDRLSSLASPYQADQLKRNLYVEGKIKTWNESVYYTVDLLQQAIQNERAVTFQYIEYTPRKEKILKHQGQWYVFSPYDLVWDDEAYYVFGWSEGSNHNKIVKFRVDRMVKAKETIKTYHKKPDDYNISVICRRVFSMYDGEDRAVTLKCSNEVMKDIIDRFGESVKTRINDNNTFLAEVDVAVSPTFFAWIFAFDGKIIIMEPDDVRDSFDRKIAFFFKNSKKQMEDRKI